MNKPLTFTGRTRSWTLPLAAAAAATLLLGTAPEANAGAIGYSNLRIENFRILNSGGVQYDAGDFASLDVTNSTSAAANLAGSGVSDDHVTGGNSDVGLQCLGPSCGGIGENDFSQQGSGVFSRGDAVLNGAIISGTGGPSEATAETVGELRIDDSTASNTSNVGTTTEFSFTLGADDTITFEFDATPELYTELTDGDGGVIASNHFSISIFDENDTLVYGFTPSELGVNLGQNSEGSKSYAPGTLSFSDTTALLTGGQEYQLTISHVSTTSAQVTAVPEPSTLLMLGAGLLGLGALGRRRKA